jgi:hypothetical protein
VRDSDGGGAWVRAGPSRWAAVPAVAAEGRTPAGSVRATPERPERPATAPWGGEAVRTAPVVAWLAAPMAALPMAPVAAVRTAPVAAVRTAPVAAARTAPVAARLAAPVGAGRAAPVVAIPPRLVAAQLQSAALLVAGTGATPVALALPTPEVGWRRAACSGAWRADPPDGQAAGLAPGPQADPRGSAPPGRWGGPPAHARGTRLRWPDRRRWPDRLRWPDRRRWPDRDRVRPRRVRPVPASGPGTPRCGRRTSGRTSRLAGRSAASSSSGSSRPPRRGVPQAGVDRAGAHRAVAQPRAARPPQIARCSPQGSRPPPTRTPRVPGCRSSAGASAPAGRSGSMLSAASECGGV